MVGVPRSLVLIAWVSTAGGGNSPVWLTPDGNTTLVKSFLIHNGSGAAANAGVYVGISGQFSNAVHTAQIPASGTAEWYPWFVLNPNHTVYVNVDQPGVMVWVSGALLLGAPPHPPAGQTQQLPSLPPDIGGTLPA